MIVAVPFRKESRGRGAGCRAPDASGCTLSPQWGLPKGAVPPAPALSLPKGRGPGVNPQETTVGRVGGTRAVDLHPWACPTAPDMDNRRRIPSRK